MGENNVSGPQVYPHIDFAWIGSSPNMCEKYNFSELEKLFFCKTSVFFKSLGKTTFQVPNIPQVYPHIHFVWIGCSPNMCEKYNLSELEKMFFCKARFHPIRP